MTDLSPAAQAVLDAAEKGFWRSAFNSEANGAAAALRAAADQVAPLPGRYPMNDYMEGLRDASQNVRRELLALADELEGNQ